MSSDMIYVPEKLPPAVCPYCEREVMDGGVSLGGWGDPTYHLDCFLLVWSRQASEQSIQNS